MYFRPAISALFAAFLFGSGTGCQKAQPAAHALPPTMLSPDTIASVHWAGKRRLDMEADAYYFSRVWSLPETARLQTQTFDRLSTSLWRRVLGEKAASQIPTVVLGSLFEELALQESYLEIRAAPGAPPSLVLATHVSERYAGVWETNSAIAAELLTGRPAIADHINHGWKLQRTNETACITLSRVGDWAVISVGPEKNVLFDEIAARIGHDGAPFVSAGTNLWLEASLDLPRLATVFPFSARWTGAEGRSEVGGMHPSSIFHLPSSVSKIAFSLTGDGANVITRARLTFSQPLPAPLPPWYLPVELMHEPLTSFTAMRGIQSWLADWPVWKDLPPGPPPDQLFLWSLAGSPYQIYLAAPLSDARQRVAALTGWLMQTGNPWLANHGYISFDRAPDANGVTWGNLPDIKPFIKSTGADDPGWLFAGLLPETNTVSTPPPAGLIQDVLRRNDLVYYDWEVTGPRLPPSLQLAQTARLIARRPQLPPDSASLSWLAVLGPRLGTSATIVNRTGPAELSLYRRSTLGLTALELQLLTGWLESPQFPK